MINSALLNIDREKFNKIVKAIKFIDSIIENYEPFGRQYFEDYEFESEMNLHEYVIEVINIYKYSEEFLYKKIDKINLYKEEINKRLIYLKGMHLDFIKYVKIETNALMKVKYKLLEDIKKMNDLKSILYDDFSYIESTKELIKNLELIASENAELDNENRILREKLENNYKQSRENV